MRSSRVAQRKSNSSSNDMTGRAPAIIWSSMAKNVFRSVGFTESLPPIEGAVDALKEMVAAGYKVELCTSPLVVRRILGPGLNFGLALKRTPCIELWPCIETHALH